MVRISMSMHKGKYTMALIPTILPRQPTRRLWQQHHHEEKEHARHHLKTPGHAERSGGVVGGVTAADHGAPVGNVVHNQDAPGDGPLLHADETATLGGRGDFGDVHGDLGGFYADCETVYDTADDEHADVLGGARYDRPDNPIDVSMSPLY